MVAEVLVLDPLECMRSFPGSADISKSHLAPYLPGHPLKDSLLHATSKNIEPQAAAPFGSASILLISYAYIKMMGTFQPPT
jgi:glycine dehydrogenase